MNAAAVLQTVLAAVQSGSIDGPDTSNVMSTATDASSSSDPTTGAYTLPVSESLGISSLVFDALSLPAIRDGLKLLLIGAFLELFRRSLSSLWAALNNCFWITVTLDESDTCGCKYSSILNATPQFIHVLLHTDWVMYWLSQHRVFRECIPVPLRRSVTSPDRHRSSP